MNLSILQGLRERRTRQSADAIDLYQAGTILFAQLDRFSYTNDAIFEHLSPILASRGYALVKVRLYRKLIDNRLTMVICLIAMVLYHGPKSMFNRKKMNERLFKNPYFYKIASLYLMWHSRRIRNLAGVLQTQAFFQGKLKKIPMVLYVDNTILNCENRHYESLPIDRRMVKLENEIYDAASAIATSAEHVRKSLITDYGVDRSKVSVIRIGSNAPEAKSGESNRFTGNRILFVGIDWERKGGPDLYSAFQILLQNVPDATLTIAGCRPGLAHPNVIELGRVSLKQISDLFASSSVFCMPSHVEPMGIAPIEAALSGLPVVVTAVGGLIDTVIDGETGYIVPVGNPQCIAQALQTLLLDPKKAQIMGNNGITHARNFSWDSVCEKMADLLVNAIHNIEEVDLAKAA